MIFIAGTSPKTVVVDPSPHICDGCGLARARHVRTDQYLSLFFIPVIRINKGETLLVCDRCGPTRPTRRATDNCPNCSRPLEPDFQFCPGCGRPSDRTSHERH